MSQHATIAETPRNGLTPTDSGTTAEAYRLSLKALNDRLGIANSGATEILLSQALDLVAEAEQVLTDQRNRIAQLERLSITDELTELYNRRGFMTLMRRQLALAGRHGELGMIAMLDLDDFKPINDRFGHPVGDRALAAVGECIRSTLRETDIIARLGGDEFAVGLNRCSAKNGHELVARISKAIAALKIDTGLTPTGLTTTGLTTTGLTTTGLTTTRVSASIGAAPYDGSESLESVIAMADHALYGVKRSRKRGRSATLKT